MHYSIANQLHELVAVANQLQKTNKRLTLPQLLATTHQLSFYPGLDSSHKHKVSFSGIRLQRYGQSNGLKLPHSYTLSDYVPEYKYHICTHKIKRYKHKRQVQKQTINNYIPHNTPTQYMHGNGNTIIANMQLKYHSYLAICIAKFLRENLKDHLRLLFLYS